MLQIHEIASQITGLTILSTGCSSKTVKNAVCTSPREQTPCWDGRASSPDSEAPLQPIFDEEVRLLLLRCLKGP